MKQKIGSISVAIVVTTLVACGSSDDDANTGSLSDDPISQSDDASSANDAGDDTTTESEDSVSGSDESPSNADSDTDTETSDQTTTDETDPVSDITNDDDSVGTLDDADTDISIPTTDDDGIVVGSEDDDGITSADADVGGEPGTAINAGDLVGRWQACISFEEELGLEEAIDGVVAGSFEFEFSADGRSSVSNARWGSPECDIDDLIEVVNETPDEGLTYMVVGNATTSEGLNVLQVIATDGVESEVAFFNINGDTLLVAEEGPDGLVTDFELPFIRQSEFLLLSEPDVVVDPVSQSNDIFNR